MRKLIKFLKEWHDLIILAPSALVIFVLGGAIIRYMDPTAAVVDLGVLSILNFNVFLLLVIGSLAYYLYDLWFGDYFKVGWDDNLTHLQTALISLFLWVVTLCVSAFVLLHNL